MKKLFLSMAMVAAGAAAYAQIGQGTMMIGGSLGFQAFGGGENKVTPATGPSATTDLKAQTRWNFSPTFGYFLTDNAALGLRLNIAGTPRGQAVSTNLQERENYSSVDFGAEIFGRYYMGITDELYFFGDAGLGFMTYSYTEKENDPASPTGFQDGDKFSGTQFGINIAPGLAYFPSPKWGIDLTLNRIIGFNMESTKQEINGGGSIENSTSEFGIGFGLNPTLGLHYYLGRD